MTAEERERLMRALAGKVSGEDALLWPEGEPVPLVGDNRGYLTFSAPESRVARVALIEFYKRMRPG